MTELFELSYRLAIELVLKLYSLRLLLIPKNYITYIFRSTLIKTAYGSILNVLQQNLKYCYKCFLNVSPNLRYILNIVSKIAKYPY